MIERLELTDGQKEIILGLSLSCNALFFISKWLFILFFIMTFGFLMIYLVTNNFQLTPKKANKNFQ